MKKTCVLFDGAIESSGPLTITGGVLPQPCILHVALEELDETTGPDHCDATVTRSGGSLSAKASVVEGTPSAALTVPIVLAPGETLTVYLNNESAAGARVTVFIECDSGISGGPVYFGLLP